MKLLAAAVAAACTLTPALAHAQEADDWEYGENAAEGMSAAVSRYDTGHAFVVQCVAGTLSVDVLGAAQPGAGPVWLGIARADGRRDATRWTLAADGALKSEVPARTARTLRGGGVVQLRSEPGSPTVRAAFELPPASANLDRVLTACGARVEDARDAIPMFRGTLGDWSVRDVPDRALAEMRPGVQAFDLSCLVGADLRTEACVVDRHTGAERYAEAVAQNLTAVPVVAAEGESATGRVVYVSLVGVSRGGPRPSSR